LRASSAGNTPATADANRSEPAPRLEVEDPDTAIGLAASAEHGAIDHTRAAHSVGAHVTLDTSA
jgi:hypothetical protein